MALLIPALLGILAGTVAYALIRMYSARKFIRDFRRQGAIQEGNKLLTLIEQPMLPHSLLTGHLIPLYKATKKFPADAHKHYYLSEIAKEFEDEGACLLDVWPFGDPLLVLASPDLGVQATQTLDMAYEKPQSMRNWLRSIAGGVTLFDCLARDWKQMRNLFNPGFSATNIATLVPTMVQETLVYRETLADKARDGGVFELDPVSLRFIMDMIGKVVLNADLGTQKGYSPLGDAMLAQIKLKQTHHEANPLGWVDVYRWLRERLNGREMDRYVHAELRKRWAVHRSAAQAGSKPSSSNLKSIIDIALQDYVSTFPSAAALPTDLDPAFRTFATHHIRMFLFAGHDSTSSTLCYAYYLLATHPAALARLRAEHEAVLGADATAATIAPLLSAQPGLLNRLDFTQAVLKETLRLFPPAASIREGQGPHDALVTRDGRRIPTAGCNVYIPHYVMHRSERCFTRPDLFLPERWLSASDGGVDGGSSTDPAAKMVLQKPAWRPFEHGPRACPAQALVFAELKVVLALTVREFEFEPAYDELDASAEGKRLIVERAAKVGRNAGARRVVEGERAYQIEEGAAHPADGMPCRVRRIKV